jgi:hypothetical protein
VAEGARLESVYTGNRIEGSNPSLSAKPADYAPWRDIFREGDANAADDRFGAADNDRHHLPVPQFSLSV